jgi:NADPH:quinone reductase-like Zn-dependent oxidoreductase
VRGAGITELGGPVRTLDVSEPAWPEPNDVLIEVYAAGVANWDDIVRTGGWDVGASPPMALGVETSGIVRSVGSAVSRFRAGDEVLTYAMPLRQGAWAQLFMAPEDQVSHKPAGMSFEEAGVFPIPALTAAQVLSGTLVLKPEEVLFVNGGGGVTGGMLVATGAQLGARVIATADPRSAERLGRFGVEAVLDYHRSDWQAEVRRLAGGSVPVAVNAVRGAAPGLQSLVSAGGRLATITNEPLQSERGISVSGFFVSPDGALLERQAASFAERGLTIPVGAVYGLAEAGTALNAAVAGRLGGGIVVDPRR